MAYPVSLFSRMTTVRGRSPGGARGDAGGRDWAADHAGRDRKVQDWWAAEIRGNGPESVGGRARKGIWNIPETRAGVLPADVDGQHCIELGCGTGYVPRGWPAAARGRLSWTTPRPS